MARKGRQFITLADGEYRAKCRQTNILSAVANGHGSVWPEARMVITGDWAVFYQDGKKVWGCNATYAAHHFEVTPSSQK